MEFKHGDKSITIPAWVIAVGAATVGVMVTDICKTISGKCN